MSPKSYLLSLVLSLLAFSTSGQIDFPLGSSYSYQKGTSSSAVSSNWQIASDSLTNWHQGTAPFWYGDGSGGTQLGDMKNNYSTFYLQSKFTANHIERLSPLQFHFDYDDGFALYINGNEVLNRNTPDYQAYNSLAPENHESGTYTSLLLDADKCHLVEGENTIAIQVFNISMSSSDVFFDVSINADIEMPEMPDSLVVDISHEAGFYEEPFNVSLASPIPIYNIKYTLDGSNPKQSLTAKTLTASSLLLIDPNSTINRPKTPAVVLRTCLATDSLQAGKVITRTYIFPSKVQEQETPGAPWPSSDINEQELIYGVSPSISNDPRYKNQITNSLKDISTLSIVTDAAHLFDTNTGIYVNAMEDGEDWERPCSFELINPDGSKGFQVGAGVRIRGGWSRHPNFPKHSFRLFFRKEYGDSKLDYPLFGDEGTDTFEKIDLRTSQNYSWSTGQDHNTMVREIFSRDLQGDMGHPYTKSHYYHLYINGLYWGLFQTQERAEANFAASYMGGNKDDYDVVKASRVNNVLQTTCTDGTMEAWENIWNQIASPMTSNENYFKLIGCNTEGIPHPSVNKWLDVDNLIDYMSIIFYTGNYDSPVSKFLDNNSPNNYYAIYKKDDPLKGFHFFSHDNEHTLFYSNLSGNPGIGIHENRVNLHTRSDDKMNVTEFKNFNPQWLHAKLTQNKEYKRQFADKAYTHFSTIGVLSQEANTERIRERMTQVKIALIAESLKWGGAKHSPAYNVIDDWEPEMDEILTKYIPQREAIVIQQLKDAGLYPTIDWPAVTHKGQPILSENINFTNSATLIITPPSDCKIAYCTNGDDPRAIGGALSPQAKIANTPTEITVNQATHLTLRAYKPNEWSALRHIYTTSTTHNWDYLKITELHYNPLDSTNETDTIDSDKFEFIELKNTHPTLAINIGGLKFSDGINYQFPKNHILAPQKHYVIASNTYKFYLRYKRLPSGDFRKNFSNGGETIRLLLPNDSIFTEFKYEDKTPWIAEADGNGYSMISMQSNPESDTPNLPIYWWASAHIGGSPFADDEGSESNTLAIKNMKEASKTALNIYPNPTSGDVHIGIDGLSSQLLNIEITSLTGQVLWYSTVTNHSNISLNSNLPSEGIYIVSIYAEEYVFTQKLIYSTK